MKIAAPILVLALVGNAAAAQQTIAGKASGRAAEQQTCRRPTIVQ